MVDYFDLYTILQFIKSSELNVFEKIKFVGAISNRLPNGLLGTNVYKPLESC